MPSGRYACGTTGPVSASTTAILTLTGNTTHRIYLYDWIFGCIAAAADNSIDHYIQRSTAPGTGAGSASANPMEPADPTALTACTRVCTGGTWTSGAFMVRIAANQRASHRWVAAPEGYVITPATGNNGLAYLTNHASFTGDMSTTMHWIE